MVTNRRGLRERARMNVASIFRAGESPLAGKTRTTHHLPTPQFLEDESGECCSRILQADGHMEYGEVGFPDNPPYTHAHGPRNLTGYRLSLQEASNQTQVDCAWQKRQHEKMFQLLA